MRRPRIRATVPVLRTGLATLALVLAIRGHLVAQGRLVLVGATLIDGTGAPPLPKSRIIVSDGRFTCVSGPDGCPTPAGDREVHLDGHWIIPGLIDTHIHLPTSGGLDRVQRLRFALGITTTRDAGALQPEPLLARRDSAADPNRAVPRLLVSGRTTDEAARAYGTTRGALLVEELARRGVDAIKIKQPFTGSHWREEILAARVLGLPVFGHTWGDPVQGAFALPAVAAGLSGMSHIIGVPMETQATSLTADSIRRLEEGGWESLRGLWATMDPAAVDRWIDSVATAGVWLEPMLAHEYYWGRRIPPPERFGFLRPPPRLRDLLPGRKPPVVALEPRYPETWDRQAAFVRRFVERGGIVVTGTDDVDPGLDLHEEMRLIREITGDPMTALLAATRDAAYALGRDDVGVIAPGRLADAVLLDADPLGPALATGVVQVMKGGIRHDDMTLRAEFLAERREATRALWQHRLRRFVLPTLAALAVAIAALIVLRRRRVGRPPPGDT